MRQSLFLEKNYQKHRVRNCCWQIGSSGTPKSHMAVVRRLDVKQQFSKSADVLTWAFGRQKSREKAAS